MKDISPHLADVFFIKTRYNLIMKTYFSLASLSIILPSLILAGCATEPTATTPTMPGTPNQVMPAKDRQQALLDLKTWNISGKVAIHSNTDSITASLSWQQSYGNYTISLFGPLGTNSLTLKGQPGKVILESSDGKKAIANTPEQLVAQQSGWKLPISNLYYWVRGLPAPNSSAQKSYDPYHRLTQLTQAGWQIQFLSYTTAHGIDLPTKIFMNHSGLNIKIIITEW